MVRRFASLYLILIQVGWRLRSRMKTFNAGLFICLNLGVDPPDVVKTNPCAKLECWLDPTALPSSKAIEAIGRSESPLARIELTLDLSQQFETLNPKVKYKAVSRSCEGVTETSILIHP